jgi:RNA polymerase sigma-70 factor (ECF subfamily)
MNGGAGREAALRAAAAESRWSDVATGALGEYGDELLGYLVAMTRDGTTADDVFGQFLEDFWAGLPEFRWESSLRTWAYALARHALIRHRRGQRRATVPLDDQLAGLAAEVRTRTATFLRSESRDRFAALRATLDPDDQTLLILRVNRGLAWRDIAQIIDDDDDDGGGGGGGEEAIARRAAALRKRFERVKTDLRDRMARESS